jgi:hypothetical protein
MNSTGLRVCLSYLLLFFFTLGYRKNLNRILEIGSVSLIINIIAGRES